MLDIPKFGIREPDVDYIVRPGSYGLVFNHAQQLLVVETSSGLHLPGGGRIANESSEQTLRRELMEECAVEVGSAVLITSAAEYIHAKGEGYFLKVCDYYRVATDSQAGQNEVGHRIRWISLDEALAQLSHESHRFGLRRGLSLVP